MKALKLTGNTVKPTYFIFCLEMLFQVSLIEGEV